MVYESPAKGRSLLVLRDGMLDVAGRGLELASSAKSVGGGLVSSALSTGSSFLSGIAFWFISGFCDRPPGLAFSFGFSYRRGASRFRVSGFGFRALG